MPAKKVTYVAPTTDVVFYHDDADGHCAGAVWKYHNEVSETGKSLVMKTIQYGYDFEETLAPFVGAEGLRLVFLDFCPTKGDLEKLKGQNEVVIIDHHTTSEWAKEEGIERTPKTPLPLRVYHKIGVSGCELTWQTLFDDRRTTPPAVWMVGRYDVWDHSADNRIVPFVTGLTLLITDPAEDDGYSFWKACFETLDCLGPDASPEKRAERMRWDVVLQVLNMGITAHLYREAVADELKKVAHEVTILDKKYLMINSHLDSMYDFPKVENLEKDYYGWGWYYFDGKKWKVSLRTADDRDVSTVASSLGGGGHKGAAGFSSDAYPFSKR